MSLFFPNIYQLADDCKLGKSIVTEQNVLDFRKTDILYSAVICRMGNDFKLSKIYKPMHTG